MGIVMDERVNGERREWEDDHFEVANSRSAGNSRPVYPIYSREEEEYMKRFPSVFAVSSIPICEVTVPGVY